MDRLLRMARWFGWGGGGAALLGIIIACGIYLHLGAQIETDTERVDFMRGEVAKLDKEVAEIRVLREEIMAVLARKQVVEVLQADRPILPRIFEELARDRPDGVYLTRLSSKGRRLQIAGAAASPTEVASFAKRLDGSVAFQSVRLLEVRTDTTPQRGVYPVQFIFDALVRVPSMEMRTAEARQGKR